jgi:hypothetical protein
MAIPMPKKPQKLPKHHKMYVSDEEYRMVEVAAKRRRMKNSAYMRMLVLAQAERDLADAERSDFVAELKELRAALAKKDG